MINKEFLSSLLNRSHKFLIVIVLGVIFILSFKSKSIAVPSISQLICLYPYLITIVGVLFTVLGIWLSIFYSNEMKKIEKNEGNLSKKDISQMRFLIKPLIKSCQILLILLFIVSLYHMLEINLIVNFVNNSILIISITRITFLIITLFIVYHIGDILTHTRIPLKNILNKLNQ